MKLAIFSDSHDHRGNLFQAIEAVKAMGVEAILFCGDFSAPFIIKEMAERFDGPIHAVFGNNDGDRFRMLMNAQPFAHVTLHGEYAALTLGGKCVGMTHYPFYADAMAKSGDYDLVCFGHDHNPRILTFGETLAVNPGALMVSPNGEKSHFAVYDTATHQAALFPLKF